MSDEPVSSTVQSGLGRLRAKLCAMNCKRRDPVARFVGEQKEESESGTGCGTRSLLCSLSLVFHPTDASLRASSPMPLGTGNLSFFSFVAVPSSLSPDSFSHRAGFLKRIPPFFNSFLSSRCLFVFSRNASALSTFLRASLCRSLSRRTFISFRSSRTPRARFLRNRQDKHGTSAGSCCLRNFFSCCACLLPPFRSSWEGEMFPLPCLKRHVVDSLLPRHRRALR